MDPATHALIEALHRTSPYQYALALTGGGTGAAAQLLNVPGGSRTLLEVAIPYSERALVEYLGRAPEQYCSPATAAALARRALQRARALAPEEPAAGVACTASLATDRPRKGDHRFHLAIARDDCGVEAASLVLSKGARRREEEEAVLDAVLLNRMAEAFGVAARITVPLLPGEEVWSGSNGASPLSLLIAAVPGGPAAVCIEPDGRHAPDAAPPRAVLSGAFNPLHHAHLALADHAAARLGLPVAFELSAVNVDKGALRTEEVRRRAAQFAWRAPLWITRAPTFVEKAALFPGAAFVVGADTAVRIIAPRYYPEGEAGMLAALARVRGLGCRFLVGCRADPSGQCVGLEDLPVPAAVRDLFEAIPREAFRLDVSSTLLRQRVVC